MKTPPIVSDGRRCMFMLLWLCAERCNRAYRAFTNISTISTGIIQLTRK